MNKQRVTMWIGRWTLILAAMTLAGCGWLFGPNLDRSAESAVIIGEDASESVDDAIRLAFLRGEAVDPAVVASEIGSLAGVKEAEPTESGTAVVVEQSDGTYTNILVVRRDDSRMFEQIAIADRSGREVEPVAAPGPSIAPRAYFPSGSKALILAPFQDDFEEDLNNLSETLEAAGFSVDLFENAEAGIDRFRGDFLGQYDVVLISSHGAASARTVDRGRSTAIATGTRLSSSAMDDLTRDELLSIARLTPSAESGTFAAMSVPWLEETTSGDLGDCWIFASACESSMEESGDGSILDTLLDLGAGGYTGFDESISSPLAESIEERMLVLLTGGESLESATMRTTDDLGLRAYAWFLRLLMDDEDEPYAHVDLLDSDTRLADDFFILNPTEIDAVARLIPESGIVGTPVLYEVEFDGSVADDVVAVAFDIDNTGEHLEMVQESPTIWSRGSLYAPMAPSYPRVDTFTFSATDLSGSVIAEGSATFTIEGPATVVAGAGVRTNSYSSELRPGL